MIHSAKNPGTGRRHMMARHAVLAVDGGGSRGRAALHYAGKTVYNTVVKGLNPIDLGEATFRERFAVLVLPLLDSLEVRPSSIRVCVALAGCGRPDIARGCRTIVTGMVSEFTSKPRVSVMSDADALVRCCLTGKGGIALIAGTGSVCVGVRRRAGRTLTRRIGGWGAYLDDGSGFRIGLSVLRTVLSVLDGRQKPGVMAELVCKRYDITIDETPPAFLPVRRERVAALAEIAFEAYELGDTSARSIVRGAAADLADMVLAARAGARLGTRPMIFLSGGLFESPVMKRLVKRRLHSALPGAEFHHVDDLLPGILEIAHGVRAQESSSDPNTF